jgi:drug/metabolite transporter (DMT)-like permease
MTAPRDHPSSHPSPWRVALALALVYVSWGTTYVATSAGVKRLPPLLFGGTRILCAGLVLLGFLALSGRGARIGGRDLVWTWIVGVCLFVGGNGLINVAQQTVPSGLAAVLVATTPLWMALLEAIWPRGYHLTGRGWLGLFLGLAGVILLMADKVSTHSNFDGAGYLLVLASAFSWAVGPFLHRRRHGSLSPIASAAWQMVLGGSSLVLLACCLGETQTLSADRFTPASVFPFFYLLVVGSLTGFVAFIWLLQHVSPALAGSYAYVNPVVALLVGWLIADETLTLHVIGGMVVILAGVALVRAGARRSVLVTAEPPDALKPPEKGLLSAPGHFTVTDRHGVPERT